MKRHEIWAEMARRKVQFHTDEPWNTIRLWGLFRASSVRPLLDKGLLKTEMTPRGTIWVYPSEEAWRLYINPLCRMFTLAQLLEMAGWGTNE